MAVAVVNGIELSFDDRGGEGVPLLLVCGTGMSASMWDATGLRSALDGAGYRTIAFDNRGMPPSEVTEPPYTVQQMADDAASLLEHLALAQPAFVLGFSLGANITQTIALTRPDLVRAAVLVVGGGSFSQCGHLTNQLTAAALQAGGSVAELQWQACLLDSTLTPFERRDDAAISFVQDLLGESLLNVSDWTGLLGQMEANVAWGAADHVEELAGMRVPCLVIGHEHDPSFSLDGRRAAAAQIPNSSLVVIPGVSHVALDPAASEVSRTEILKFLDAH